MSRVAWHRPFAVPAVDRSRGSAAAALHRVVTARMPPGGAVTGCVAGEILRIRMPWPMPNGKSDALPEAQLNMSLKMPPCDDTPPNARIPELHSTLSLRGL